MLNRLYDLRVDSDMSQLDVSNYLSIKQPQYNRYETGKVEPKIYILEMLADLYNTSTDYILCRTDVMRPYPRSKRKD